ncbi:MAG: type II toxin-antitoxin system RelE/ParE family toxin [Proteobacteria bacterium]|nr:type II toxin-antitoxin system RelE/ParE family toxin [Pseudomonadota bacterium]
MRRLVFTPAAQANLIEIAEYIENSSGQLAIAERFITQLIEKCEELANLPGTLGRLREELLPELRSVATGNYVIFFRYVGNFFEVINILEGHRDIERYFRPEE